MIRSTSISATVIAVALATSGCDGNNSEAQSGCSAASFKGAYIYALAGFNVAGEMASQRTPFAQAGREVYPGDGTLTASDTTVTNGVVQRTDYTATYTLESDCAGTYTYDDAPSNPFDLFVDASGEEFAYVATAVDRVAAGYERRK